MTRSKRLVKTTISSTGVEVSLVYCRRCMQTKRAADFFSAVDLELDKNGLFSICKDCINDMYTGIYAIEQNMARTIFKLCRILNIKYDERAMEALNTQLQSMYDKGKDSESIFGVYKVKLQSIQKGAFSNRTTEDLTFQEPTQLLETLKVESNAPEDIKEFWGKGLPWDDLQLLEKNFAAYSQSYHGKQSQTEKKLLKYICLKELEIDKALESKTGASISKLVEDLQKLYDTAALSPKMVKAADTGDSIDTYGKKIETIERTDPAEWLESEGMKNYGLFRDVFNIEGYFQDYFVRPLRNLLLQVKDFNIKDEEMHGFDEYEEDDNGSESEAVSE